MLTLVRAGVNFDRVICAPQTNFQVSQGPATGNFGYRACSKHGRGSESFVLLIMSTMVED